MRGERRKSGTTISNSRPTAAAFPLQTTAVPEVSIRWRKSGKRLIFRWYKLSSSSKTRDWVEALAHRSPPPLAVIGGGNSYSGLELARQMKRICLELPEASRPLLLLTTATADHDPTADVGYAETTKGEVNDIYPDRTFRFCFTNRQMAFITTRFLWFRDDLRPEAGPVFQVAWDDDSYSPDLLMGYQDVRRILEGQAQERDWLVELAGGLGSTTLPLSGGNLWGQHLPLQVSQQDIFSSVGTYHAPNQFESTAVHFLLDELISWPKQRRTADRGRPVSADAPLPPGAGAGGAGAPEQLVVVAGDTIAFNNIYRDRLAAWRTQDLPFPLVFFCHRNPIDAAAGFDPAHGQVTGTEDVLLFRDLIETVVAAFTRVDSSVPDTTELAENLHAIRLTDERFGFDPNGVELFSKNGKRNGGTGEHVVYLRPLREPNGKLVLPHAEVEVWTRDAVVGLRPLWRQVGKVQVPDPQVELDRGTQP